MDKKVLLVGTLDTKGKEFEYLKNELERNNLKVVVIDAGVLDTPFFKADIPRERVAKKGGSNIGNLIKDKDRGKSMKVMMRGVKEITKKLFEQEEIDGIMGMGGGAGSGLASSAMEVVPIGFPKLIISTMACGDTSLFVKDRDIVMLYSVTDVLGLNKILKAIISNGAAAMAGMINSEKKIDESEDKLVIGATMLGVTTKCVEKVKKIFESMNYEVIAFHAIDSGGRAFENIIGDGIVEGVMDITTTEIMNTVVGGVFPAGPDRLETAGRLGIPQVVTCGALDFVNFWTGNIPEKYRKRKFYQHNPMAVLMRTNGEENVKAAIIIAEKLNKAKGPTAFFIPLRGFSSVDTEGKKFYDPNIDNQFIKTLTDNISSNVKLFKLNNNINDPEFAERMVKELHHMIEENIN